MEYSTRKSQQSVHIVAGPEGEDYEQWVARIMQVQRKILAGTHMHPLSWLHASAGSLQGSRITSMPEVSISRQGGSEDAAGSSSARVETTTLAINAVARRRASEAEPRERLEMRGDMTTVSAIARAAKRKCVEKYDDPPPTQCTYRASPLPSLNALPSSHRSPVSLSP